MPDELLGDLIEEDSFRPPKAKIIEKSKNSMVYANVIDRNGRTRQSRGYISDPFAPHQCSDAKVFDVLPEDGQEITGFKWYYGHYLVWKEQSFYTLDPDTLIYVPRETNLGNIAIPALDAIPGMGFGG